MYELCFLTCQYLVEHDAVFRHSTGTPRRRPVGVSLVTPEKAPLEAFGSEISSLVRAELEDRNVSFLGERTPIRWCAGRLETEPQGDGLAVERVIALPRLGGVAISGLPTDEHHLIPTDRHGRVGDLADVYAAGDITSFPIKQGGIAAQQALAVAQAIAAEAGAGNSPEPFEPVLRGLLLTGDDERFLRSTSAPQEPATASSQPLWWPPGKIAARYLTAYLAQLDADPSQRT
jgi:sulfide:quinone oxidoreductase